MNFRADALWYSEDPAVQDKLRQMCSEDILFWVSAFCWTYDPRKVESPRIPFITWDYQDIAFDAINRVLGYSDLLIEKSRDMGASWILLTCFVYQWLFRDYRSFMLVSRNEDLVDKKDEPDALFWKIDFILESLPHWMVPNFRRRKLSLFNLDNKSSITGATTTSETSRGGRKTAIGLDEFASVPDGYAMLRASRDNTNCRIYNSTPKGAGNAFADLAMNNRVQKIRFHWTLHPEKALGLYYDDEGKPRSPWYDVQCQRAANAAEIAQELDIDYTGSDYTFFDVRMIDRIAKDTKPPPHAGMIDYDRATKTPAPRQAFASMPDGPLWLWVEDPQEMPKHDYVIGCDISAGTGASNSSAFIFDATEGVQVGEYTTSALRPDEFADIVVVLCRWLKNDNDDDAFLIWEKNGGPGMTFGNKVIENGFRNFYYTQNETILGRPQTMAPGWHASKPSKQDLFEQFRRGVNGDDCQIRSEPCVDEMRYYIFTTSGSIEHSLSINTVDPSGAKDNHGDRCTAGALAWKGAINMDKYKAQEEEEVPDNTFAARRAQRADRAKERSRVYW